MRKAWRHGEAGGGVKELDQHEHALNWKSASYRDVTQTKEKFGRYINPTSSSQGHYQTILQRQQDQRSVAFLVQKSMENGKLSTSFFTLAWILSVLGSSGFTIFGELVMRCIIVVSLVCERLFH